MNCYTDDTQLYLSIKPDQSERLVRLCVCVCVRCVSDLGLSLLQQCLQSLLSSSSFMVVADDQDDVVPPELPHQVEPNLSLVGVRGHGPQEGQVDALEEEPIREEPL